MSYTQWLEEQQYDTESEYLNVLRQEHYDPEADWGECQHGARFNYRDDSLSEFCGHCEELTAQRIAREAEAEAQMDPWQDVPF